MNAESRPEEAAPPVLAAAVAALSHLPSRLARRAFEREYLIQQVARCGHDRDAIAAACGMSKDAVYHLLRFHGIRVSRKPRRGVNTRAALMRKTSPVAA